MQLKYGLEKEYFVHDYDGNPVVCPYTMSHDVCGLLAEARGDAYNNITDAVFSLMADEHRLAKAAKRHHVTLVEVPVKKISRDLRIKASREYQKGLTKYHNLYSWTKHRNLISEMTAGVHVSFTNPTTVTHDGEELQTINQMWDWVQMFKRLDEAFKEEIKSSKRRPGFYEIKSDGRIEYRSLPNTVDLFKLIEVIEEGS